MVRRALILLPLMAALAACAPARPPEPKARPATWTTSPNGEPLPFRAGADDCRGALAAWFGRADRNGDGALDLDEMLLDAERWFALADRDHDGQITAAELAQVRAQLLPEPEPEDEPQAGVPPARRALPRSQARVDPVMQADANADFRVTAQEFRAHAAARFAERAPGGTLPQAQALDDCGKARP